jgi:ribosomal protein S18 acetylase RimI-like enzyme
MEVVSGLQQAEKLYPAERWRLCWLAVSPKCQRTGIGRRLVQWGLDRCEEEGIPAVLESSIPGKPLYEKMGFREIGWASYDKGRRSQPVMLRPVEETKKTV